MTTTPTPTPENPDRPYYVGYHPFTVQPFTILRHPHGLVEANPLESQEIADLECDRLNDAHESAAQAKRLADSAPELAAEVKRLREALETIRDMRPEDHGQNFDEWGEAACFTECKNLAKAALTKAESTTKAEEGK